MIFCILLSIRSLALYPQAKAIAIRPPADVPMIMSNAWVILKFLSPFERRSSNSAKIYKVINPLTPPPSRESTTYFLSILGGLLTFGGTIICSTIDEF
jgi:hypothetical protein